ncbi:MAG: LEA type 2 family protein [Lysobacterales bacterium]|jgi:LEA14-like dessication related protein
MRTILRMLTLCLAASIASCATLDPDYEEPTVTLTSFKALPSEGMVPSFEIGLRIINPNRQTLTLQGIVYTISLEGHELVKGVGKDFAPIEGYSQGDVHLTASANLLAGIRLIGDLARSPEQSLDYAFQARLDLGGLYPSLRIAETGTVELGASPR